MTTAVADAADALQAQEMSERPGGGDIDFDSFRDVAQFLQEEEEVEPSSMSTTTAPAASKARFVSPKDFVLMKVIGMGAFGKVLQVRNKESKQVLAMKVISKRILRKRGLGYIENMLAERHILSRVGKHPFIVGMHCSFQTREKLFIIMDFLAGGELFLRLGKQGIFLEKTAAFYLSEIILALDHLHNLGVLHRDLKPENILLGSDGHICLTDFGLAKDFGEGRLDDEKALTICGTQEYMAPEMIARKGYGRAADYWSLGCIAYEMLSGLPPFSSKEGSKVLFSKIMSEKVKMPIGTTAAACKLLKGLLNRNVLNRLGAAKSTMFEVGGVASLKQAEFFAKIDWEKMERKQLDPPAVFELDDDGDVKHFHDEFTQMPLPRSVVDMSSERFLPRRVESDAFRGFSFILDDFVLPLRDELEEKSYWKGATDDGESVSECASSKLGDDQDLMIREEEAPKKKRPPRKKKKKGAASSAASTPVGTATNTPNISAANTPEPSVCDDIAEEIVKDSAGRLDQDFVGLQIIGNEKGTEISIGKNAATVREKSPNTTMQPRPEAKVPVNNETKAYPSPQHKAAREKAKPRPRKVTEDSWNSVNSTKQKAKKSSPRKPEGVQNRIVHNSSLNHTSRTAAGAVATSRSPQPWKMAQQIPRVEAGTSTNITRNSPNQSPTAAPHKPPVRWGDKARANATNQVTGAEHSSSTGSSDWRQHSMSPSSKQVKPAVTTTNWPSLGKISSPTSPPKPKVAGAWATKSKR